MRNYRLQNCYQILGVDKDASTDEITSSAHLAPHELASLPNRNAAYFLNTANELGILLVMREAAAEILTDPFRRAVYDWNLQAYEEWKDVVPEISGAIVLHPLRWTGGFWDERDSSWELASDRQRTDSQTSIAAIKKINDRIQSGSNAEPISKLDWYACAAHMGIGLIQESRAAHIYVAAKILACDPSMAHEESTDPSLNSPFKSLLNILSRQPSPEPAARRLFTMWLQMVNSDQVSSQAVKESLSSFLTGMSSRYYSEEFTAAARRSDSDAAIALIKKWPSLAAGIQNDVEWRCTHEFQDDPSFRRLRAAVNAAKPS